jgi:hypothetical protein
MRTNLSNRILVRPAILLLIFAIAGLTTLAKQSRYLPESNPSHYLSSATKLSMGNHPIDFLAADLRPVAKVVPLQPEFRAFPQTTAKKLDLLQIGLVVSLQHRAPPSLLA